MSERTENCFACRFYEEVDSLAKKGVCHRFPPSVMSDGGSDVHPVVGFDNWCGEFKHIPHVAVQEVDGRTEHTYHA